MERDATMDGPFDDYFSLMDQELSGATLLLFHGCSGSGKSSYLAKLQEHQSFLNHEHHWFFSDPKKAAPEPRSQGEAKRMAFVDEVTKISELVGVARLTRRFDVVAVATHVHPLWFGLFRMKGACKAWSTNGHPEKIERYLRGLGHSVRLCDVEAMCKEHGASYAIADIVREHHPSEDFGRSWAHFKTFAKIRTRRDPDHKNWRVRVS